MGRVKPDVCGYRCRLEVKFGEGTRCINLGQDFLDHFVLTVDSRAGLIRLEPQDDTRYVEPVYPLRSGLPELT